MPAKASLDNMRIWDAVCKTNPSDTKEVDFGRKFTAIDAYTQIKKATEVFGPPGINWGWSIDHTLVLPTDEIAVFVRIWHGAPGRDHEYFCAAGQCGLYLDGKKTRLDGEAAKKALTNAVTKGLSYLGFNADVFMGQFDDDKYVQKMKNEFAGKNSNADDATVAAAKKWAEDVIVRLNTAETLEALNDIVAEQTANFKSVWESHQPEAARVKELVDSRRKAFADESPA
ncbi:MAG: hypothetical protein HQ513_05540 [Rhodospirillales bacterium]|nr:hypothetical protein [Rhodospirillales bacterium]